MRPDLGSGLTHPPHPADPWHGAKPGAEELPQALQAAGSFLTDHQPEQMAGGKSQALPQHPLCSSGRCKHPEKGQQRLQPTWTPRVTGTQLSPPLHLGKTWQQLSLVSHQWHTCVCAPAQPDPTGEAVGEPWPRALGHDPAGGGSSFPGSTRLRAARSSSSKQLRAPCVSLSRSPSIPSSPLPSASCCWAAWAPAALISGRRADEHSHQPSFLLLETSSSLPHPRCARLSEPEKQPRSLPGQLTS